MTNNKYRFIQSTIKHNSRIKYFKLIFKFEIDINLTFIDKKKYEDIIKLL